MAPSVVSEQDFEREVLLSELPVLVEFSAEWCGPCKLVAPELRALAADLVDKAKIVTVDIDRSPMLARQLGVQSVPAFVVFHQGRPVGGKVGALKRAQLREMLDPYLLRAGRVKAVDTRERAAFDRAHIPDATHMPGEEIEGRLAEIYMLGVPPVLYCRSGDKTKEIAQKLAEQGVAAAFLEGGLLAWEAAGLAVEKPD
jgi:thioredoxin